MALICTEAASHQDFPSSQILNIDHNHDDEFLVNMHWYISPQLYPRNSDPLIAPLCRATHLHHRHSNTTIVPSPFSIYRFESTNGVCLLTPNSAIHALTTLSASHHARSLRTDKVIHATMAGTPSHFIPNKPSRI